MSAPLPVIPRLNNIGLLRLVFALVVMAAHLPTLQGHSPSPLMNAELAVQGFFVISGFLIVMSYEQSSSLRYYAVNRFRRIYPAYAAVVFLCAVLGALFTSSASYFNGQWLQYVLANLVFLNFLAPELPGVFTGNPIQAVNGALWTIKIEVMFYLLVPLLVWALRGRRRLPLIAAIYAGSLAWRWACERQGLAELGRQLPGQMAYFISGTALYYYFDWVRARWRELVPFALAACLLGSLTRFDALYPAGLAVLVMAIAFFRRTVIVEHQGDFSYGVYIWHFPIIQALVALSVFATAGDLAGSFLAYCLVALMAWLSWRFVEKPALRPSSYYRNTATA